MLRIEPLGTTVLLPAFVVGYEITDHEKSLEDVWTDAPDWLIALDQQAGGYGICYRSVAGAALRFCDNGDYCRGSVANIVRGFQAMAEDPDLAVLRREYPILAQLVGTWGENYRQDQLARLNQFLARYFNVPDCESGVEAFVRLAECDPLRSFQGWNILRTIVQSPPRELYQGQKSICIDVSNIGSIELSKGPQFDGETLTVLHQFGSRLKLDQPSVFLLWENSD